MEVIGLKTAAKYVVPLESETEEFKHIFILTFYNKSVLHKVENLSLCLSDRGG